MLVFERLLNFGIRVYLALGEARQAREEYDWAVRLNPDIRGNVEGSFTPRKNLVK
jgi:hypothetical protein